MHPAVGQLPFIDASLATDFAHRPPSQYCRDTRSCLPTLYFEHADFIRCLVSLGGSPSRDVHDPPGTSLVGHYTVPADLEPPGSSDRAAVTPAADESPGMDDADEVGAGHPRTRAAGELPGRPICDSIGGVVFLALPLDLTNQKTFATTSPNFLDVVSQRAEQAHHVYPIGIWVTLPDHTRAPMLVTRYRDESGKVRTDFALFYEKRATPDGEVNDRRRITELLQLALAGKASGKKMRIHRRMMSLANTPFATPPKAEAGGDATMHRGHEWEESLFERLRSRSTMGPVQPLHQLLEQLRRSPEMAAASQRAPRSLTPSAAGGFRSYLNFSAPSSPASPAAIKVVTGVVSGGPDRPASEAVP